MMLGISSPLCGSRVEYALDAVFFRKYLLRQNAGYSIFASAFLDL